MAYNSWSLPNRGHNLPQGGWGAGFSPDEQLFHSLGPVNGLLSGAQARPALERSGLSTQQLAQVWSQADANKDGFINQQEFCKAMTLTRQMAGASSNLSHSISANVLGGSSWGGANPSYSITPKSYTSSTSLASTPGSVSPLFENQSFFPSSGGTTVQPGLRVPPTGGGGASSLGTPSSSSSISGGVGRTVSLASLSPNWSVSADERRRFNMMFNTNDKNKTGFLSAEDVRKILTKFDVDKETLRKIWDLSDVDKDGRLSSDEFAIAMFLVEKARKGIPPPTTLPLELQPKKGSLESHSPSLASNFEDRRRENFEKGRAELERRRRAIEEKEQKEKDERERKRREEEERKRQEEMRIAAAREAELEKQRQKALEIERARERAVQLVLLKREAEVKEAERKRKEEWTKRRIAELQIEKKREMGSLQEVKHYYQELMDQLTKNEVEKRTVKLRVDQARQRCAELATGLDHARRQQVTHRELLMGVASELKNWRQELLKVEYQRQQLQSRLAVQMTGNEGEEHSQLTNKQQVLSASVQQLRITQAEASTQCEQLREQCREKSIMIASVQSEVQRIQKNVSQLQVKEAENKKERQRTAEITKRKQALEEAQRRQREVQERFRAQKEEERRKKERERLEEERMKREREELEQEKEMRSVLEQELTRLKKTSVQSKEEIGSPSKPQGSPPSRPRSQVTSIQEDEEVMRKVAELQARKKQLQDQRNSPKQGNALRDLAGINFNTGPPINPAPISTKAAPLYESPDTATGSSTDKYGGNDAHIYELPDKVVPRGKATPTTQPINTKPALPPKPSFLKHSANHPPQEKPVDDKNEGRSISPPTGAVVAERKKFFDTAFTSQTTVNKTSVGERIYDEPPRIDEEGDGAAGRPKKQERIYDEPPRVDEVGGAIKNQEPLYDEPPRSDLFTSSSNGLTPPTAVEYMEVPQTERVPDALYGNVTEQDTVQELEYGNVPVDSPIPPPIPPLGQDAVYEDINVSRPPDKWAELVPPTSPLPFQEISYRAQFPFTATNEGEISFDRGDILVGCSDVAQDGWIKVEREGESGWVPIDYLQPIKTSADASQSIARVKFVWNGTKPNHLSLTKGQLVAIKKKGEGGWWMGEIDGKVGWFPHKFVEEIAEQTSQDSNPASPLPPPPNLNEVYKAVYAFKGEHEGDLTFPESAIITVVKKDGDWWMGEYNGNTGMFPSNYVTVLSDEPNPLDMDTLGIPVLGAGDSSPKGSRKHPLLGRVIVSFTAVEEGQMSLTPGQLVVIRRQESNGWWEGQLQVRGEQRRCGWFPANRIELMTTASSQVVSPKPITPATSDNNTPATTPPTTSLVLALYSYQANSSDELSFHKGSVISVINKDEADWWKGELNGQIGFFPRNYVQTLDTLKSSEPTQWSDHVKPEILEKVPTREKKRQEAIFELIHSEKSYVFSLNLVKEVFFVPLENSNILTESELSQVFVNWEEIIECNTAFCNALFIRLRTSGAIVRIIGDLLQDYIPQLVPHIRWCSCQLTACTLLQSKASDPQFKEFEQKCMKDSRTMGLPLSSFLLKPMQRVTKYPLLINKILEYTQNTDPDYELLLSAMTQAEDLCSQVNEAVKQKENSEKLEWLQTHVNMTVNEKLVFNSSTNFMGSRKLLHFGKVLKIRGNREMLLFLFNDFLLLARPKAMFPAASQMEPFNENNYFTMHREPFLLDQITVKKPSDDQHGPCVFIVVPKGSGDKNVPFKAESDVSRDQWYKVIMEAIVNYTKRKKQANKLTRVDSRRVTLQQRSIGKLIVTVVEAADLIASSDGISDPFCVVRVGDNQEAATPVIKNSLNPHWNYAMEFFVDDFNATLEVTVFDSDLFSPNDFLGSAKLNLKQLREEGVGPWNKRVLLEDVPKGELELKIAFRNQRHSNIK